ncbi:Mitochondrial import inner membrane translocase subunit TIM50 [Hibiscus syriacus]|uniref:Mitochondrial import inner membrane translocase subunit TIM50 n=1 Tax=Hibiscus syriacus TaxID=106335 RepID=A0A6A2XIV6_HIBSY|nr:Mitochondrial import inner membrane translocase subunit TIM50 [Hibiscus syriacus]
MQVKDLQSKFLSSGVDSSSSNPSRETIIASQSILSDQSQAPLLPRRRKLPQKLREGKLGAFSSKDSSRLLQELLAMLVISLTVKCSYEEVAQKAKALRAAASFAPSEDASAVDLFSISFFRNIEAYFTAMTVPAKALESYLDLRRLEAHINVCNSLFPPFGLEKRERGWRTFKGPGVDAFLEYLAKYYEIVVYSDQMNMYVDPVCERLDPNHCIRYRLSRGDTKYQNGKHYRDLSKLNRDPAKILYVSAHAFESSLQPENCVPIKPFKLEGEDTTLLDLIPFLEYVARNSPPGIRQVIQSYERKDIAKEFLERSKEYQRLVLSYLCIFLETCRFCYFILDNVGEIWFDERLLIWNNGNTGESNNKGNNKVASGGDEDRFLYS